MVPGPEISVVVGAYRRSAFLGPAVRSALAQTLERERFEVVVTKTFDDPELDEEFRRAGVVLREDHEPRLGRWLRRAVAAARAPVVAFLDDDDEFEPERLARIAELFRAHPDLGFYRNRVRVIDDGGGLVPPERWRPHESDAAMDASGPVYRPAREKAGLWEFGLVTARSAFNSSTMAIRRELLDGEVGDAFEPTHQPDLFLFLSGIVAPYGMFLDDRRLTRYRYHGRNMTHTLATLAEWPRSHREMEVIARCAGETAFADWLAHEAVHFERMFQADRLMLRIGEGAERREIARLTEEYFRFLGAHPAERAWRLDNWAAGLYGLGYVGARPVTRPLARARIAARAAAEGRPDPYASEGP